MPRATLYCLSRSSVAVALSLASIAFLPARAQTLPQDAKPLCTIPDATFATWFRSGTPSRDGAVKPASSVTFPDIPNCSFYQWAEQMFFWLTSPPLSADGSGPTIDTALLYDVSAPDPNNNNMRTLQEHKPGVLPQLSVRAAQLGPRGLPVIFSKAGQMLEIERPQISVNAPLRIRNSRGEWVEVAHAEHSTRGDLILRDATGVIIGPDRLAPEEPSFRAPTTGSILVQRFVVNGVPIFIDRFGNIIDVEPGQADADSSVLQAQNGSLIYYGIMVNNVYAVFQAGVKHRKIEPDNQNPTFPASAAERDAIISYAAMNARTLTDADALAVEVKTAWIEADCLSNPSDYVIMNASVPTYDMTTDPKDWKPNGTKSTKLALIGMHVVGSAKNHPEMIWATFEHFGNTPNAAYEYVNSAGVMTVPQSIGGSWLFSKKDATGPFNEAHMTMVGEEVQAVGSFTVSPSDTIRWKSWGAASDIPTPNPTAGFTAGSNTEIIAINNSVHGKPIMQGDVRNNYFLVGATWTNGNAPDPHDGAPTPTHAGNQVGTSHLANSTMETYEQGTDTKASGSSNCFSCHSSNDKTVATTHMSHIFDWIIPLF